MTTLLGRSIVRECLPQPQPNNEIDHGPSEADPRVDAPRTLTEGDVAALIINKMIGTGIFTGPYAVLLNTQNKTVAMVMWAFGFLYTILSMMMYLEYARKLPFTGGELVYLDDIPGKFPLLAYTMYGFYFIFVYTTCTNAMRFAAQLFLIYYQKITLKDLDHENINSNLLRFFAVVITTAVCVLLYVSNSKSRLLNKATALAKIITLLVIAIFGGVYIAKYGASTDEWIHSCPPYSDEHPSDYLWNKDITGSWTTAFILVSYSFHGWENATLVAGEIPSFSVLRRGFRWAVCVVGCLYLLVAGLLCAAFDWKEGPLPNFTTVYFSVASEDVRAKSSDVAAVMTAIIIAISAIGSMISVAYTGVRVKQSIGWANILPWSWFWRRCGPIRPKYEWQTVQGNRRVTLTFDQDALTHPGSPEGGVVLHWMVTVVYICLTAPLPNIDSAIDFAGNLLVYGHFFMEGLVAIGFIWFDPFRERFRNFDYPSLNWYQQPTDRVPAFWMRQQPAIRGNFWSMKRLRTGPLQTLLGVVLLAFSIVIVVAGCFRGEGRIALAITGGLLVIATIYWVAFIREESAGAVYRLFGYNLTRKVHGVDDYPHDPKRICHWCFVLKAAHRHPHDSYESYNGLDVRGRQYPRVLYTIFSDGSKPGYLIQSWSDLGLAIKGLFTTAGKEPEAETALTRIENRNTRE